ncbi:PorV/PorQ family protein [Empedobacter falsenii]|uniref:PorV/PorQ family protein n=1 Tax=Empedobacter falsenii TaxID=343874 RepID=A0ABY8V8D7_9FLAO|nr:MULTISPECIES: PorV/PorQ family protein [Empedobacter]WIH97592.1 PorV/PorQ family protein [Empedobacter falsenii]HJD86864.1 PorV/PorQ family protein [Empedobacter falsenii]
MKKIFLLLSVLASQFAFSQTARKYSNEFLNIGADARSFAMGNAVVANIGNANASYWNPAGLTEITYDWEASAMHAEYFQSIAKFDYAAVAIPLRESNSTIAFSLMRFGVDDILNTTELIDNQGNINYDKISKFSTADYALTMSYAGNVFNNKDIQFGANAKIVYRHIGKFAKGFGFGIDLGLQYRTDNQMYFGVMARDITTTFNAWSINKDKVKEISIDEPNNEGEPTILNDLPGENIELTMPKLQFGVGKKFDFNDRWSLLGEVDMSVEFQQTNAAISGKGFSISPQAGIELAYDDMVFVRGGLNNLQKIEQFDGKQKTQIQPNVGVGFKYKGISIDYALTNFGDSGIGLYSNIFSVRFEMDKWR